MKRLPSRIKIMDYTVPIRIIGARRLKDEMGDDYKPGTVGLWDDETRTIWILKSLSYKEKRATLLHELQHALVDLREWE